MPVHDWTRVTAGTYHDFHLAWIAELRRALNSGVLPSDFYALAEQRAGNFEADLLTLERHDAGDDATLTNDFSEGDGAVALLEAPPKLSLSESVDLDSLYALKRRTLTIRHANDDHIVALLEITSPGNKDREQSVKSFVDKAITAAQSGFHLVVIDLLPPRADGKGLCSAIWTGLGGRPLALTVERPMAVASFHVAAVMHCYAEPIGLGMTLPDAPLFFSPEHYVNVPLESTYDAAYAGVPKRWRRVIEGEADA